MNVGDKWYYIPADSWEKVYPSIGDIIPGGALSGCELLVGWTEIAGCTAPVLYGLEAWQLTEGYEFEVRYDGMPTRWRIVPDDGGEYGCRALRVD